ncbi:SDR family oxidoreductase [Bacillus timonensis]|uniref:SDR family oxidoreductase n=1 Tax=Bacillus timonensis TaxID=1033734 RepID=A0A4S3PPK7_9BACI|nr:SDR family oxidoreductase [Bacillus timonensis]THE11095.1 SDR family oxidoreductase [Bacillus timonensis]
MTDKLLEGKVVIVTGAGSGMGKEISKLFSSHGAQVVVADINKQAAELTASELESEDFRVIQVDVSDNDSVEMMVKETFQHYNKIDVLINCAGVPQYFTPIEELSLEKWDRIFAVNTKSIFLTSKHVVPIMKERKNGAIINIASIAGVRARPGLNAYCASKGAAIMLTKALALELAPFKIRVNAINPGPAETPMLSQFISGDRNKVEAETKNIFIDSVPLGTLIQPSDIAHAALYLSSDFAKVVTGEIMNVDGGRGV